MRVIYWLSQDTHPSCFPHPNCPFPTLNKGGSFFSLHRRETRIWQAEVGGTGMGANPKFIAQKPGIQRGCFGSAPVKWGQRPLIRHPDL